MIFQRGNPMDYERWAREPGLKEWDYLHCLPYFKRMENCLAGADDWRGGDGPLKLERGPATNPLFDAFFQATVEAGYHLTDDVNGYRQEGFARFDRNVYRGRRLSAARAYLHPVRNRKNLTVRTLALGDRVRFEGKRAVGVDYERARRHHAVEAGEVILCGGAINTPQLLQLSGVGDEALLKKHGIPVVHHLPGVGENLQDHLEVYIQYASKLPVSIAPGLAWHQRPKIAYQWLFQRKGLGATNHFEGGGFARSNDDVDYPNLMFHFLPIAIRYDGTSPVEGHGYQVAHRPDVRRHPGPRADQVAGPAGAPVDAVQLPVDRHRPQGVGGGDPGRARHPQPAGVRAVQRRRDLARGPRSRPTRRSSSGCAPTRRPRCTRRARPGWASTRCRSSTRTR